MVENENDQKELSLSVEPSCRRYGLDFFGGVPFLGLFKGKATHLWGFSILRDTQMSWRLDQ